MSHVHHATQSTFPSEVLQSPVPVLVDFYADWCGPCRKLAPSLERLAAEFGNRARIVKVNIDEEPELADRYQVQAVPTLAFLDHGRLLAKTSGLVPEASLRQALHQLTEPSRGPHKQAG
jgi:thioredoxin